MREIIEILMRRDNLTENEALNVIADCQEEMEGAIFRGNYQECEDILALYLGLEPDYLDYFLF